MTRLHFLLAKLPFAPVVAGLFACVAVILVIATPQWLFESWVAQSGVAAAVPAATPPLGATARIGAALFAGGATAVLVWLLITVGDLLLRRTARSADFAEPVTQRGPLFADRELGAPLMSDEAMAQARDELILDTPITDAELVAEIEEVEGCASSEMREVERQAAEQGENLAQPSPAIVRLHSVASDTFDDDSIAGLLERLDAAIARRPAGFRPDRSDLKSLRRALGR